MFSAAAKQNLSRLNASEPQALNLPEALHYLLEVFLIIGEPAIEGVGSVPCYCRAWRRGGRKWNGIWLRYSPVWARKSCIRARGYRWEKCGCRVCIGVHKA